MAGIVEKRKVLGIGHWIASQLVALQNNGMCWVFSSTIGITAEAAHLKAAGRDGNQLNLGWGKCGCEHRVSLVFHTDTTGCETEDEQSSAWFLWLATRMGQETSSHEAGGRSQATLPNGCERRCDPFYLRQALRSMSQHTEREREGEQPWS